MKRMPLRAWVGACLVGSLAVTRAAAMEVERLEFREPARRAYVLEVPSAARLAGLGEERLRAWPANGSSNFVLLGRQVVLKTAASNAVTTLLAGRPLRLEAAFASNVFLLRAPDSLTAARQAAELAVQHGVLLSHPVRTRRVQLHGGFVPRPNDPLWGRQWHLENRDTNTGVRLGFDSSLRAAWAVTRGEGITVALGDDGMETDHPDLQGNATGAPHYNFVNDVANGRHTSSDQGHGTAVAGLIAATDNNGRGVAGVAPAARLASWVIFDALGNFADEAQSMQMFQHQSNVVAVQNHSWGNAAVEPLPITELESQGIANAVEKGRQGRGVVMVRAAGNERALGSNANDDGFASDPRAITVGAVRANGRVTSYSTPGDCVLLAGFSADTAVTLPGDVVTNYPTLGTTDRRGSLGYNSDTFGGFADYAFDATGFEGTSGSTPQIAGLCALVLAVNPELSYRDVQQVLVFAARQLDPADRAVHTNGAGLRVSHNVGFGVPDAGRAVALAQRWHQRPARTNVTVSLTAEVEIPDDALRVEITGGRVPAAIASIPAWPGDGLHPDTTIAALPLVDVGQALGAITNDLSGRAALIQRGVNFFAEKIARAAAAGARFVVIYNNRDVSERVLMNGGDIHLAPIPAVFIDQTSGEALRDHLAQTPDVQASLTTLPAVATLTVTNTLICEHVQLRVRTSHTRRADLRVVLVSPAGTRSVLQQINNDMATPLDDLTYSSVHHFYESSAGDWRVEIVDERTGVTGQVLALDLTLHGVPVLDTDRDGLDDNWERAHSGNLAATPVADPDLDGWTNAQEQILQSDPRNSDTLLRLAIDAWDERTLRLAWPATPYADYTLLTGPTVNGPFTPAGQAPAGIGDAEWLVPLNDDAVRVFKLEAVSRP